MLKVVIVGYGEMFTNLIAGALDANCDVVGVFRSERIKYNSWVRRVKDCINPSLEYNYIKSYNLHEIEADSVNSEKFKKVLVKLNPDIMLVGSWAEKISKATYDIPKIASINAHPSLLPKYRGPNPYFWVIRNQEQTSGISFHLLDKDYDTGAILAQEEVKIYPSDTGKTLKERVVLTARGVVCELLKDLSEDIIIPLTQIEEKSSYYSFPDDLEIDFTKPAEEISALIRAIYPWRHAYFQNGNTWLIAEHTGMEIRDNDTEFKTPKTVTVCSPSDRQISILCGNNKILTFKVNYLNKYDRFFISNYLKSEIKTGQIIE